MDESLFEIPDHQLSRSRLCSERRGHHRVAAFPPAFDAAGQRAHTSHPPVHQYQRRTGAGGFVRSGTIKDDLTIQGELRRPVIELTILSDMDPQSAWNHLQVLLLVKMMAQVDDSDLLARIELCHQFLR